MDGDTTNGHSPADMIWQLVAMNMEDDFGTEAELEEMRAALQLRFERMSETDLRAEFARAFRL